MSFRFLWNFLQNQAQQNDEVRILMENLSIEIEKNQMVQQQQLVTLEKKMQLQIELETLRSVASQLEEERKQHDSMVNNLSVAHQNSLNLFEQLKKVDLQKLAGYEIFVNDMQRQQEQKEMEEMFQQRQEICQKMENRHIVQQLRRKQAELKTARTELQEVQNYSQNTLEKATKKLEGAKQQRNEMVLSLVKGSKELQSLREEIKSVSNQEQELQQLQAKKIELTEQLRELQELSLPQQTSSNAMTRSMEKSSIFKPTQSVEAKADFSPKNLYSPSSFDRYNPMDFIKSLDIKFDISKAMQELYQDLEVEKKKSEMVSTESISNIRSILRPSNEGKESQLKTTTSLNEARHVRFVEPNASSSGSVSSPAPSMEIEDNISSDDNKTPLNAGDNYNNDEQLDQNISEATVEAESTVCLTLSPEISPAQSIKPNFLAAGGAEPITEPVVKILECRIVKPAGTAIPKTLPISITPSPSKIHELPVPEAMEVIATTPVEAISAPKVFKSPLNVLDKTIDTKTSIKNALDAFLKQPMESNSLSDSEHSNKSTNRDKQSQSMDFDSYYLSNISPDTEEEENAIPSTSHGNNSTMFFDFGGSTEHIESDEVMNFSDNDFQPHTRNLHDFF